MLEGRPSRTALRVATRRAAHQLLDRPIVFEDPLALTILGPEDAAAMRAAPTRFEHGRASARLRAFLAVRARFAEETLAAAVANGVRQYVVLGAGLDTFAYRNPHPPGTLRIFEVDHPATQQWKRECLARAGISVPTDLTFVPVDFASQSLGECLRMAGLSPTQPAFFSWLGVTMYLERSQVLETLACVASATGAGGGIVFDYAFDPKHLGWHQRIAFHALAARVRAAGEPWRGFFQTAELEAELARIGFARVTDVEPGALYRQYTGGSAWPAGQSLAHLMRAVR